jgi:hypothetical protein
VRLAFSVATTAYPDILIIDEALGVGHAYFQHKSLSRIRAFQERGVTLLFVTHHAVALKAVCRRALLLDNGRLLRDGPVESVFDFYNALIARRSQAFDIMQSGADRDRVVTRSGTREAEILALELMDATGVPLGGIAPWSSKACPTTPRRSSASPPCRRTRSYGHSTAMVSDGRTHTGAGVCLHRPTRTCGRQRGARGAPEVRRRVAHALELTVRFHRRHGCRCRQA